MSGGHFDYKQHHINDIADEVRDIIITNQHRTRDEWGNMKGNFYSKEVITHFRDGLESLEKAAIYAQRIDWLVSGDDGPESFIERLQSDLKSVDNSTTP